MKTATKKGMRTGKVRSKFNDEFEKYLKAQCLKTTFNGLELETFSWYKKVLGLVQCLLNKAKRPVKLLLPDVLLYLYQKFSVFIDQNIVGINSAA